MNQCLWKKIGEPVVRGKKPIELGGIAGFQQKLF